MDLKTLTLLAHSAGLIINLFVLVLTFAVVTSTREKAKTRAIAGVVVVLASAMLFALIDSIISIVQ